MIIQMFKHLAVLLLASTCLSTGAKPLPSVHVQGSRIVDVSGQPVTLRGCNLGNWLLIEPWMLAWEIDDQETIIKVLGDRFGQSQAERLMTIYRDGYITPRDFDLIKSFGFNLVRLPFDSRMLIDADGKLRPDAFKYIDRALQMAEDAGVYVILDMHGAPGSQSIMDHTGMRNQNKIWSEPKLQDQMVELWRTISTRYKDRTVVAAYDIMNEPYGDFRTDMRPALRELMPRCYQAIRSTGDKHIVIFPNALGAGITFYGDLKSKGYTQLAFTDHYYPGLFGSPSTLMSHAGVFDRVIPEAQAYLLANDAAMLIGEFNVVLEKAGGDAVMRRYFDEFATRGWMATMWSHKLLKPAAGVQPDNWYLVTNEQALPVIDVRTSTLEEIEAYFSQMATMPLAVDDALRQAITSSTPPTIHLPALPEMPSAAPADRDVDKWRLTDVNTSTAAGVARTATGVEIVATGSDIYGKSDSFAFLHQPAPDQAVLCATVDSLGDSATWAKAGLMIRFGPVDATSYDAAPCVMINTFTDGTVAFLARDAVGAEARETKRLIGPLPQRLCIVRRGPHIEAYVQADAASWISIGTATIDSANAPAHIGLATSSNSHTVFTSAKFSDLQLTTGSTPPGQLSAVARPSIESHGDNLLKDPTFGSVSRPNSSWHQWGDAISTTSERKGVRLGSGGGLWQDINVSAGSRYSFATRVRRPAGSPPLSLTLSIEAVIDGKSVAIADRQLTTAAIESDDGWSIIRADAVAAYPTMRVLIRTTSIDAADSASIEIEEARAWQSQR